VKGVPLPRPPGGSALGGSLRAFRACPLGLALAVRPAGSADVPGVNGTLALSAWELVCHASLMMTLQVTSYFEFAVSDR
jgi:hypothetical protein